MTGLINFTGFEEAESRPSFTAVTKPDTFDVENKRVSNQLGLIKRAIGGGKCAFVAPTIQGKWLFC